MTIRHSKKALFIDAFIGVIVFMFIYFGFERFLSNDFGIYIIGFFITLLACFMPFSKYWLKYKFNYIDIENEELKITNFFNKVVIPINKFSDYKISASIYEKLLKMYNLDVYTIGGETYHFERIDREINFEELLDKFTAPAGV